MNRKAAGWIQRARPKSAFEGERRRLKERWDGALVHDPFYNPNLTLDREDFFRKRRAAQRGARMTPAEEKAAVRRAVRRACAAVPADVHAAASSACAGRWPPCRSLPPHTVAAFLGTGAEPGTRPLLHAVLAAGKRLCLPVCGSKEREMHMAAVTGLESLVPGPFGILQPGRKSFARAPSEDRPLPCALRGRRRSGRTPWARQGLLRCLLPLLRPGSTAVLCCFSWQLVPRVPREGHDIRLSPACHRARCAARKGRTELTQNPRVKRMGCAGPERAIACMPLSEAAKWLPPAAPPHTQKGAPFAALAAACLLSDARYQ